MAATSPMVHHAVVAFSSLQLQHGSDRGPRDLHPSYYQSQQAISFAILDHEDRSVVIDAEVQHVLAAAFLLSYIDLVAGRTESAHTGLRRAFKIVSALDKDKLNTTERILISWIRLLDARAVSAGGEGLFLQEEEEQQEPDSGTATPAERDVESVLSDILLKPSQQLFQKTQYFMGRITKIDRWHRSRDTVEDESEVMAIAAQIRSDIHKLYQRRHPLMDVAVAGRLESPLIADGLARRVTRSSRMALANYHASFIHLHRVAHRHLLRTKDVTTAISTIKQVAHSMVQALGQEDTLPKRKVPRKGPGF
ncbi:hypothetical protein CAC42_5010 [Sphaceloma murrayae]|uniref:Uncharacterized protein n=1 Tax=Sphaceloma murrayae TaxID=2082308 RepID=A0A2K1QPK6_9PEZI|nr:hypothetical protein CAC42_5010 [Sphaceloma murrayae]